MTAPLPADQPGLCGHCAHVRHIVSGKGSVFLLCEKAATDPDLQRYPALPVLRCPAHLPKAGS